MSLKKQQPKLTNQQNRQIMKWTKIIAIAVVVTIAGINQTNAQTVAKKQVNQTARISNGVKSGELTRRENRQLAKQQRNIQRTKRAAKADGVVTRKEKAIINQKQKNASANVYRKRHNARDRN